MLTRQIANVSVVGDAHAEALKHRPELREAGFVAYERGKPTAFGLELHHAPVQIRNLSRLCDAVTASPYHRRSDDHKADQ